LKIITLMAFMSFLTFTTIAMENYVRRAPQKLLFIAALKAASAKTTLTKEQGPEEIIDLVNKIKNIQEIENFYQEEKKFFLDLLSNDDLDIESNYGNIIQRYLGCKQFMSREQLLSEILVNVAVSGSRIPWVNILIDLGANVNYQNFCSYSVLMMAAFGNETIVKTLIQNGADVNFRNSQTGFTALFIAVAADHGYEQCVRILLDNGANVNVRNNEGETALFAAASKGHEKIIELLLENGADVNLISDSGETASIKA